jgi:hypothetical protein
LEFEKKIKKWTYGIEIFDSEFDEYSCNFWCCDQSCYWEAIAHGLADGDEVRDHTLLLKRPVMRANTPETRLNFIGETQSAGRSDGPAKNICFSSDRLLHS